MKNHLLLLLFLFAGMRPALGQGPWRLVGTASTVLATDQIRTTILNTGDMFWNGSDGRYEIPKGSGKHSIFTGALWLGGYDASNQLRLAASTYRQTDRAFFPGPVANTYDSAFLRKYDHIWKIRRTEIDTLIAKSQQGPILLNDIPRDIATWPTRGNQANGEAPDQAEFVDLDGDGMYSPQTGDYPLIRGDVAAFFIVSDHGNKRPYTQPMMAEAHVMVYGYNAPANTCLSHALFLHYKLINRSSTTYTDVHAAQWMHFELGNYMDNYVGSMPGLNAFYVYNADNDDSGSAGYGINPPALAVVLLNKPMTSFVYYQNDSSPRGNPWNAPDYYNYMKATWRNGTHVTEGGNGYGGQNPTNFMYSGDPVQNTGWIESTTGIPPYDRRGIGATGPFTWAPGQVIDFDIALVYARGTSNLNSVQELRNCITEVQQHYDNVLSVAPAQAASVPQLQLFPNPTTSQVTVQLQQAQSGSVCFEVYDMGGRLLLQEHNMLATGRAQHQLRTDKLAKGIYSVKVSSGQQVQTARLVKL